MLTDAKYSINAIKPTLMEMRIRERQRCEVWSRVMGYFRPVSEWNIGKKQEHCDRTHFVERIPI